MFAPIAIRLTDMPRVFCQQCGKDIGKTQFIQGAAFAPGGAQQSGMGMIGSLPAMSVLRSRYRIIEKRAQGGMATVYRANGFALAWENMGY